MIVDLENIGQAIAAIQAEVLESSATPRLDAEVLVAYALDCDRAFLYAYQDQALSCDQQLRLADLSQARVKGKPIAYILGVKEFWGLPLKVDQRCLIPRPDTETLVEAALSCLAPLADDEKRTTDVWVADVGTGSGAVALALAQTYGWIQCVGTDYALATLTLARENYGAFGQGRCHTLCANWASALASSSLHMLVSNPPYLSRTDEHLTDVQLGFEPIDALVSGGTGLEAFEEIIYQGVRVLKPGGWLLLEHGSTQGAAVRERMSAEGFADIHTQLDLAGLERVTLGVNTKNAIQGLNKNAK